LRRVEAAVYPLDRNHPAIAATRQGFDIPGFVSGVLQGQPQPLDRRVDAVFELHYRVIRPESLLDVLPHDHFTGPLQQDRQDLE